MPRGYILPNTSGVTWRNSYTGRTPQRELSIHTSLGGPGERCHTVSGEQASTPICAKRPHTLVCYELIWHWAHLNVTQWIHVGVQRYKYPGFNWANHSLWDHGALNFDLRCLACHHHQAQEDLLVDEMHEQGHVQDQVDGEDEASQPRKPTLLLTSSHGLERPPHRPGMPRPPWMLIDAYGGKKAFNLKEELPMKRLPWGLKHAVVMLGGNDISVPKWRWRTARKLNLKTTEKTANNLVEIYKHLREDQQIEGVTIFALLPCPSDEVYLPGLVDATNGFLAYVPVGQMVSLNTHFRALFRAHNFIKEIIQRLLS